MTKIELKIFINEKLQSSDPLRVRTLIREIKADLDEFIKEEVSYNEKLYLFYHDDIPHICESCKKPTNYLNFWCGYRKYCPSCAKKLTSFGGDLYKKAMIEKYGEENPNKFGTKNFKQAMMKKYGVESSAQSKKIKNKMRASVLKKYGVENISQLDETKEKKKETNLRKYGVKSPWNQKKVVKNNLIIKKENYFNNLENKTNCTPLFNIDEYSGIYGKYKWGCKTCGYEFFETLYRGNEVMCPKCFPKNTSISQNEISEYIKSFNITIVENTRSIISPLELDIYIPSKNLAIEFNGLYWHSELYKDKNYHLQKTEYCEKLNIQLIHIFEDEWLFKKEIVKSRLNNILGLNSNRIGARKCLIQEVNSKEKNIFLNKYHIQGSDKSSVNLGAYYDNSLIGIMTFSKPRLCMGRKKSREGIFELSRFATIDNTYTPGLASKLLKHFITAYKPIEMYSYADRRWSQGKLYDKIGFKFDSFTAPNYWYINSELKRHHRFNYRKDRLKSFPNYSKDKSEKQIMNEAGFLRVYDCGNYKFIWR